MNRTRFSLRSWLPRNLSAAVQGTRRQVPRQTGAWRRLPVMQTTFSARPWTAADTRRSGPALGGTCSLLVTVSAPRPGQHSLVRGRADGLVTARPKPPQHQDPVDEKKSAAPTGGTDREHREVSHSYRRLEPASSASLPRLDLTRATDAFVGEPRPVTPPPPRSDFDRRLDAFRPEWLRAQLENEIPTYVRARMGEQQHGNNLAAPGRQNAPAAPSMPAASRRTADAPIRRHRPGGPASLPRPGVRSLSADTSPPIAPDALPLRTPRSANGDEEDADGHGADIPPNRAEHDAAEGEPGLTAPGSAPVPEEGTGRTGIVSDPQPQPQHEPETAVGAHETRHLKWTVGEPSTRPGRQPPRTSPLHSAAMGDRADAETKPLTVTPERDVGGERAHRRPQAGTGPRAVPETHTRTGAQHPRLDLPANPARVESAVPLPLALRFTRDLGMAVGKVPVYRGSEADARARRLGARAFTERGSVFIPESVGPLEAPEGQALLAHELVHAVQQTTALGTAAEAFGGSEMEAQAVAVERWVRGHPVQLRHLRQPPAPPATARPDESAHGDAVQRAQLAPPPHIASLAQDMATASAHATTGHQASSGHAPQSGSDGRAAAQQDYGRPASAAAAEEKWVDLSQQVDALRRRRCVQFDHPAHLDALADRLYDRVAAHLRRELVVARERHGLLTPSA